jgi:hypothetical protein
MKKTLKAGIILLVISLTLSFAGCSKSSDNITGNTAAPSSEISPVSESSPSATVSPAVSYPTEASTGTAAEADTVITLNGDSAAITGAGASSQGSTVTISAAGAYLISGTLDDGQIIVNTSADKKVELILNGVSIYCSYSSAIHVISSPKKTLITLAEGSVNILSDGQQYTEVETDKDQPTACIFSMEDLEIAGTGALYVTGNYNKGIFSKDDLTLSGGSIYVTSVDDGIRGKDSVTVTGGTYTLSSGADGLRSSNDTDDNKGSITIENGTFYITAALDAIQSVNDLSISGGTFVLSSGGGSINGTNTGTDKDWSGRGPGMENTNTAEEETDSAKALKAAGVISISGGSFNIDSCDDAIHSNDTVNITGGSFYMDSGDDGIHADNIINISGGDILISKSYEGIEACVINISGGSSKVSASDDGLNAAGGADGSSVNGRPGQNSFGTSVDSSMYGINIGGGYIFINADGDGVDSNGSVTMTEGSIIVFGPTNDGNGALDYQGSFTLSGGFLLAAGSSGMAQSISSDEQGVIAFKTGSSVETGTLLYINKGDETVLAFTAPKVYSAVVYTSPEAKAGDSYTIYVGGTCSGEISDYVYNSPKCSGGTELGNISAS